MSVSGNQSMFQLYLSVHIVISLFHLFLSLIARVLTVSLKYKLTPILIKCVVVQTHVLQLTPFFTNVKRYHFAVVCVVLLFLPIFIGP